MAAVARSKGPSFEKFGSAYHLKIRGAEDLAHVLDLNEAHWVATGAPVQAFAADPVFLEHLDQDHNQRILADEVKNSIRWLLAHVKNWQKIQLGTPSIRCQDVYQEAPDGEKVLAALSKILDRLELPSDAEVSLEQVRAIKAAVEGQAVSASGVVLEDGAENPQVATLIETLTALFGGVPHPSGKLGITAAQLDRFVQDTDAYRNWLEQGKGVGSDQANDTIHPLGAETGAALALVKELSPKLEQFFTQCRALRLDPRLAEYLRVSEITLTKLDLEQTEVVQQLLAKAALGPINREGLLDLEGALNPAYEEALAQLQQGVLEPLLHRSCPTLNAETWTDVQGRFNPFKTWRDSKPASPVTTLSVEELEAHIQPKVLEALRRLINISTETAFVLENVRLAEKVILFQSLMLTFVNNFVSFPHLYDPDSRALFEMGSLVMDGRRFNMAVRVGDRKRHIRMAKTSLMYVLYVAVQPKGPQKPYEVAVPVTHGGKGNLCKGKRGIFLEVDGEMCDATVVALIENPISLREAVMAPFKRIGALLTGKLEALTADASKELEATTRESIASLAEGTKAAPTAKVVADPTKAAAPAPSSSGAASLVASWGVALAALGSSLAYITKTLAGMTGWSIVGGMLGAVVAVVLPATLVTAIRLNRRDLSAILEGAGWAINARMGLTWRQSRFFTERPGHPGEMTPIAEGVWWVVLTLVVLVLAGLVYQALGLMGAG